MSQCTAWTIYKLLSLGKGYTVLPSFFFSFLFFFVKNSIPVYTVFLCLHTAVCEADSITTGGLGIFNVRTFCVCECRRLHTKGRSGTQKKVCTRVDSEGQRQKLSVTLPRQGIKPRVFGFEPGRSKPLSYVRPPRVSNGVVTSVMWYTSHGDPLHET